MTSTIVVTTFGHRLYSFKRKRQRSLIDCTCPVFFRHSRYLKIILAFAASLGLQACASYGQYATSMRDGLITGHPKASLEIAEKKDPEQEEVISSLDKGMLRRINADFTGSNQVLEVAKKEIEKLYGVSLTENLASVTINETLRGYEGDRYEQLLLHAYMAMNYIQLGQVDGARVEMLQADVKMMEWGDAPEEDAFVRYFEGMIYESLGEKDNALISYRKAYNVYKEKGAEQYPAIPVSLKKDLLRLLEYEGLDSELKTLQKEFGMQKYKPAASSKRGTQRGELIVVLNNGLAPIREEASIYIFSPEVEQNLRVAFPVYRAKRARLNTPNVLVNNKKYTLETVENIDKLARHALSQAMPGIMARATARAVVKYNTQHTAEKNGSFAGLLMTITNLVTERADTRSWSTLPQEIELARISLPAGEHKVQIQILNASGRVIDVIDETVVIEPRKSKFIIKRWIAPLAQIEKSLTVTGTGNKDIGSKSTDNKSAESKVKESDHAGDIKIESVKTEVKSR